MVQCKVCGRPSKSKFCSFSCRIYNYRYWDLIGGIICLIAFFSGIESQFTLLISIILFLEAVYGMTKKIDKFPTIQEL